MKSSSRPLKYQEDLPVFKSHDNMGAKKTQHNRNAATSGYSLEAQQHFYQRYNTIKANESVDKKQANLWHAKSNSMSAMISIKTFIKSCQDLLKLLQTFKLEAQSVLKQNRTFMTKKMLKNW